MAYVYTRPESRYWWFFFQHAGDTYRGSTGIEAYGKYGKRTVNRPEAREFAARVKRHVQARDIDALRSLNQHRLADRIAADVLSSQKG